TYYHPNLHSFPTRRSSDLYSIKIYILLCFLPAAFLWIGIRYMARIRQIVARILLLPVGLACIVALGYFAIRQVAQDDPRYNLSRSEEHTSELQSRENLVCR